jgi:hypothetical protein
MTCPKCKRETSKLIGKLGMCCYMKKYYRSHKNKWNEVKRFKSQRIIWGSGLRLDVGNY